MYTPKKPVYSVCFLSTSDIIRRERAGREFKTVRECVNSRFDFPILFGNFLCRSILKSRVLPFILESRNCVNGMHAAGAPFSLPTGYEAWDAEKILFGGRYSMKFELEPAALKARTTEGARAWVHFIGERAGNALWENKGKRDATQSDRAKRLEGAEYRTEWEMAQALLYEAEHAVVRSEEEVREIADAKALLRNVWNAPAPRPGERELITVLGAFRVGPVVRLLRQHQFGDGMRGCEVRLTDASVRRTIESM
jgi:hypothetical protein